MKMDVVERDRGTNRAVKILDSFKAPTLKKETLLVYDNFYTTKYWVKHGYASDNFFTLFFARRYFNRLKKKYRGEQ